MASEEWNPGEEKMHRLLKVPPQENPTSNFLTPFAASIAMNSPLMAIGAIDEMGQPWTSVWGGTPGFVRPVADGKLGVKSDIDASSDPVVLSLSHGQFGQRAVASGGRMPMISALPIDLERRRRVKIFGRVVKGEVKKNARDLERDEVLMIVKVEQSLGNCPKYLNKKHIVPAVPNPRSLALRSDLCGKGLELVKKADLFFLTTMNGDVDMDTNHRGGPPGFVRAVENGGVFSEIVYPEYSGNRLYQSLGNLTTTPKIGLTFPDFSTGDVLYITGTASILIGEDAKAILPRTNLAVKIRIKVCKYVEQGLSFRGIEGEPSPYNPPVRRLAAERELPMQLASQDTARSSTATLVHKVDIAPTITRYRFRADRPVNYSPGGWVALDFSEELDMGYSHMRDDDPKSLNDDFVRTFTVTSYPGTLPRDEFEITARLNGPVTHFLKKRGAVTRIPLAVGLQGFGEGLVLPTGENQIVPFVAGGVGITPLISQLGGLEVKQVRLFWIIKLEDVDFVLDTFSKHLGLAESSLVFFTGSHGGLESGNQQLDKIQEMGAKVKLGRPEEMDLLGTVEATTWYMCAGSSLRRQLSVWLRDKHGKELLSEDFDY